ncbi:hypothetical protein K2173_003571 [Erythroxylum novogranatense]|uniref:PGG domain-containing protein n=1 Tax=Erythroxylum novogranatense TaxID=1862640 RepID=A0AAV8TBR2_9ROSI|nr:hypothetical protein K2173_003571 [Erythroxylum novogranatense]
MGGPSRTSLNVELKEAACNGHVDQLYDILVQDSYILDLMDQTNFVEAPIHIAARAGKTLFVVELATLKPYLALKLNAEGDSALHLALKLGHIDTTRAIINLNCELIRVKGKRRMTPLHAVVKMGHVSLLEEFLYSCPSSIEDLTTQNESPLHIATKNMKLGALRVLFGFAHRINKEDVLNLRDDDGNTILHIAVSTNSVKAAELLVNNVDMGARNRENCTTLDIFRRQGQLQKKDMGVVLHRASIVSNYLNTLIKRRDSHLGVIGYAKGLGSIAGDIRSVILVVVVLISTATYQAVLSPPGGYWQDGRPPHVAGKIIMGSWESSYFGLLNTSAFCASVCTIIVLVMGLPFAFFLEACTMFISCSYFVSVFTIFPSLDLTTLFLLLMFGGILIMFHLVAFEVHRRKREKQNVGKGVWIRD